MFDFKPSMALVQKFVENLRSAIQAEPRIAPEMKAQFETVYAQSTMEDMRSTFGRDFVACVGMHAQRARYMPEKSFTVIENGRFPKHFEDDFCGCVLIVPEGESGDLLFAELAKEFIEWVKAGDNANALHPHAPIAKFTFTTDSVTAHVKPPKRLKRDPDWTPATIIDRD